MAATGNVTITGNVSNMNGGASINFGPATSTTAAGQGYEASVALTTGANTITINSGTTTLIITGPNGANPVPNPSSGAVLTLKGVAGDTGVGISNKWPTCLQFDTSPATIVINASTGCTIQLWAM